MRKAVNRQYKAESGMISTKVALIQITGHHRGVPQHLLRVVDAESQDLQRSVRPGGAITPWKRQPSFAYENTV